MASTLLRKSWTDLSRRRARTMFAVATLALAVASVGVFAVPSLMDRAMRGEVAANRLADLRVETRALPVTTAQLARLRALPGVEAVEPRTFYATRVYVGARRAKAFLVGIPDFARQRADVVTLASGRAPGPGEVLTEAQNARRDRFAGDTGAVARVLAADGSVRALRISGVGRSLEGGQDVAGDDKAVVLYAPAATVAALSGRPGFTSFAFRLHDGASAEATAARARAVLGVPLANLPEIRDPAEWPGKSEFEDFISLFSIVTALALVSALVLVANTMTTLIAEQTGEIGTMKALGARRRQVEWCFLRSALMLGALGVVVGVPLGLVLANALVRFFGTTFYAIDPGVGVAGQIVVLSAVLGVAVPALAALPAIRRAARISVREALDTTGSVDAGGVGPARLLRRASFLPRTAQIGLGGAARRRRRSLSTVVVVALAVGNLLAVMALGAGATRITRQAWSDHGWQVWVGSDLRRPLDARAERIIRATPGVAGAEPAIVNDVRLGGEDAVVWATAPRTTFRYRIASGRWYSPAEDARRARVAVVERNLARATGTRVGDRVRVATGSGSVAVRVVGIAANQQEDGTVLFVPLRTARALLGSPRAVNAYWVRTVSGDHGLIDRTTTRLEDALGAHGYEVGTEITYVGERDNVAENRTITMSIAVLGLVVIAISMVALVNAITMSVLERTREIGILRCIGARGRDVRQIFGAEGLALAVLGWAAGIPLGYAILRLLVWLIGEVLNLEVPVVFPLGNLALALAGTVAVALVVMLAPLRRAARFRPGEALRYA